MRVNVLPNGRLVLPIALRRELGVERGGTLVAEMAGGAVRLVTPDASLDAARALFQSETGAGPDAPSVADEVIAERRAEADGDGQGG